MPIKIPMTFFTEEVQKIHMETKRTPILSKKGNAEVITTPDSKL
jgi:hypothetical protein